ncbi:MAG: hypothetical protein EOP53_12285 [Sphingobacteriales bacterium]|nr:MAG: hypothetical protein EOP53_12285 [Sphingobacteriales bacterium]
MMRPVNICLFNTMQSWGGGEKWHYETAILLKNNGFNVMLITSTGSELHKKLQGIVTIQTIAAGNLSFLNPVKLLQVKKMLLAFKTDTVLMNLPSDLKLAGLAAKWAGIKNIIYRRGSALPVKNSVLNRYLFGKVITGVIANSIATKKNDSAKQCTAY